tara:strand:+ start:548 stop:946 length:399 start_codon:yes stop_codon:yes gene_type:complete
MIKKVKHKDILYAIIVSNYEQKNEGIEFITDGNSLLEFGIMNYKAGHKIQPHQHKPYDRLTSGTNEVLFIKKGRVCVDFFDENQIHFLSETLKKDDWIILLSGGHGFSIIDDSEMIEVKNGPYANDDDKVRF